MTKTHFKLAMEFKDREIAELLAALRKQRKAWDGVRRIELDGPIVDFAEKRISEIDAIVAKAEGRA